jgi:hypothetical protein
MKKDMSDESFRSVEDAAHRIMDAFGERPIDAAHEVYTSGHLSFMRHSHMVVIRYKDHEVLHTYAPGEEMIGLMS